MYVTEFAKWDYFRQSKQVSTGINTCKRDISLNHRLLHHQNLWWGPYLRVTFETFSPFLCLKWGPKTFTIVVTLLVYGLDQKCNTDNIQLCILRYKGRPDVKCIHCAMITLGKKFQARPASHSTSSYKLHNHHTVSQYKRFDSCSPCSLSRCLRAL